LSDFKLKFQDYTSPNTARKHSVRLIGGLWLAMPYSPHTCTDGHADYCNVAEQGPARKLTSLGTQPPF